MMKSDEEQDQLLTASDAARILGLSRDMVRILSNKGILPSQRAANGYHLFRRGDVEELARKRADERAARKAMMESRGSSKRSTGTD
jgi:predicted site-specific integrase-resolvase